MSAKIIMSIAMLCAASGAQNTKPSFSLADLAGNSVSLAQDSGKIVVIDFWATWCTACKEAFPRLNKIHAEYASKNVVVMGINVENLPAEKIKRFAEKAKLGYTILLDPKGTTTKTFGIKGVPSLAVIGADGLVVKLFRGLNPSTEKEIVKLLDSLVKGTPAK
jgi:peroxiredoxin